MKFLLLSILLLGTPGEDILNQMASRYAKAPGIHWSMQSEVYSPTFDETETSPVEFTYNPPDTFYFKGQDEEILGIADTVWIMSKKHKQIQKKISNDYLMPSDLVIKWNARYNLENYETKGGTTEFDLVAHEGITPANVNLTIDRNKKIKSIYYKDSSGNDVTLTVQNEKLSRSGNISFFNANMPKGYKLIDLTE
jgi:outer membrane lipoprotein-sorting protein